MSATGNGSVMFPPTAGSSVMSSIARGGFRKVDDRVFHFTDHEYAAFVADLEVDEKTRPSVHSDPMMLNRPEDRLDQPGILEQSMDRGASNPHAEWTAPRTTN